MKFTCNQQDLGETLSAVSRVVPLKSVLTILSGIKFTVVNNVLTLVAYDQDMGISKSIDVNSDCDMSFVVDSKNICDIIRLMPNCNVTFEVDDNFKISISNDKSDDNFTILSYMADEFPNIPVNDSNDFFTIDSTTFKNMIKQTIFSVALNAEKSPILVGELFSISKGEFTMVALDGFRLAICNQKINTDDHFNFVIHNKTLSEILKLLKDNETPVNIYISRKHVTFEFNGYSFFSRLLDGEFSNYEAIIKNDFSTEVTINCQKFITILEKCSLLINDKNKAPVICSFSDNLLSVQCKSEVGKYSGKMEIEKSGSSITIAFNCRFLLDALRAANTDKVKLFFNEALSPMKMTPLNGNEFTFIIVPTRYKN